MNFEFNKWEGFASAYYNHLDNTIVLNFGEILRCDKITDDEKIKLMTWQIEHEVIHAAIANVVDMKVSSQYDDVSWTLHDKKEFLEYLKLFKLVGYKYMNACKHLEK